MPKQAKVQLFALPYIKRILFTSIVLFAAAAVGVSVNEYLNVTKPLKLLEQAKSKVFKIVVVTQGGAAGGTAFILSTKGYGQVIVTNRHICDIPNAFDFMILEQDGHQYFTRIKRISKHTDLCLLETPGDVAATEKAGFILSEKSPVSGETLYVTGHPFLGPLTIVYGPFQNELVLPPIPGEEPPMGGILSGHLDFLIRPGNSGSPVLNKNGEVVGVAFASDRTSSYMIPLSTLNPFIRDEE